MVQSGEYPLRTAWKKYPTHHNESKGRKKSPKKVWGWQEKKYCGTLKGNLVKEEWGRAIAYAQKGAQPGENGGGESYNNLKVKTQKKSPSQFCGRCSLYTRKEASDGGQDPIGEVNL